MALFRPRMEDTTTDLLNRLKGKFFLLNVTMNGRNTSVCVNNKSNGSAACRQKEQNMRTPLFLSSPCFSFTSRTLVLTFEDVNALANNFHSIFEAVPSLALDKQGRVAVGTLPRDGAEMGQLLHNLEVLSENILAIHESLELPVDTPIHALYRSVRHQEHMMDVNGISEFGSNLLTAFEESQERYVMVPPLRRFGTDIRGKHRPKMRGALLRHFMQHNPTNPLNTITPLRFIDYELKPLHISDNLTWICQSDPRTESIDLLLSFENAPVITEVKMAGDSFVSAAVVQIFYYASIMANNSQQSRLTREYKGTKETAWLCIIAEDRDETKSKEFGFQSDLNSTLEFLQSDRTRNVMSQFYRGVLVIRIRELEEPYCHERNIPAFQVVDGGETVIRWRLDQ